uniref:Putative trypsin n=1 Tax=Lutzomyia longipalpis TaxID=7200 RepID=A0A1B0GKR8_LUTLO
MNFHDANDVTIHPNYNPTNLHNNLAILHLVQQVPYTPVQLPPENPGPSPVYLYYGFGTTNPNNNDALPNILQQAQTIELPVPECQRYFGNQLVTNASWCCAAAFNMGLCNGDQGGPLLHFHNHHLVGIASFWMTPCNSGFPNVFVRISHYVEWIRQVTGA